MTDADAEIVEDTKNILDVTDDSCVLQLTETVSRDRISGDDHKPDVLYPVVEVKQEDLQAVKQEPVEVEYCKVEDPCFTLQVRSACTHAVDVMHRRLKSETSPQ